MNKETRIQKIQESVNLQNKQAERQNKPALWQEIKWESNLQRMAVYRIPLKYLVYNKYNGRILSRTESLEAQGRYINPETKQGDLLIENLLWDSKPDRNKRTMNDIKENEQLKVGVITRDGIIIDGNRRAMLLKRLTKEGVKNRDYFKAIVLPVTLEESPIEIERLETSFQMGEDEKLGYNPVEKYLKSKKLKQKGILIGDIAGWMGENKSTIEEYLSVMETMDSYLDYLEYDGVYTQLDGREDQFINLTKWLKNFYYEGREGGSKGFTGYKNDDVDDLKYIAFDYIRVKYEGKKFRHIAYGQKTNHFFGNKLIWESFRDKHFDGIKSIQDEEENINLDSENLTASLNDRDEKFKEKAQSLLDENINIHDTKLGNQQAKDQPVKLINRAIDNIFAINKKSKNFDKPEVLNQVEQLNQITTEMLQEKSPKRILKQIFSLISSIKIKENIEEKDELLECVKDIEKEAYQLEKEIKHLK